MMMTKKIAVVALAGLIFFGCVGGCTTKIQIIDDGSSKTNKVQNVSTGFNDETYIWESWSFSTNRVDK